jgi:hypothetical protein
MMHGQQNVKKKALHLIQVSYAEQTVTDASYPISAKTLRVYKLITL